MLHVHRTGRPNYWFYIILIFPGIGSAIYLFTEILPGTNWDITLDAHLGSLAFFKKRLLAHLADAAEFSPTVQNQSVYADELARQGQVAHAVEIYQECLRGAMKDDAHLLFALAEIQEQAEAWDGLLETLTRLRPDDARREENRVLRLRGIAFDGLERFPEAEAIFRQLLDGWPGEEIRCRLALLLMHVGKKAEAMELFEQIKSHSKRGNSHYRQVNRRWIRWAMHVLKEEAKQPLPPVA